MKLPVVSGTEATRAFGKVGYEVDEQHGSHIILRRAEPPTDVFLFRTTRNLPKEPFEP